MYVIGSKLNTVTHSKGIFARPTGITAPMNAAGLAFRVAVSLAGIDFIAGAIRAAHRRSRVVRWRKMIEFLVALVTQGL